MPKKEAISPAETRVEHKPSLPESGETSIPENQPAGIPRSSADIFFGRSPRVNPKRTRPPRLGLIDIAEVSESEEALVMEARENGWLEKLPPVQRRSINLRFPQKEQARTYARAAKRRDVHTETIRQSVLRALNNLQRIKEGKEITRSGRPAIEIDTKKVIDAYPKKSMEKIAEENNCSPTKIWKILHDAGVEIMEPSRKRIDLNVHRLAWQYFMEKMSLSEIGELNGVSTNTIYLRLVDAGYTLRPPTGGRKK